MRLFVLCFARKPKKVNLYWGFLQYESINETIECD